MKRNSICKLFVFTLALLSTPAHAQGVGVRDGGHWVYENGRQRLLDLVTTAVCDWRSGSQMIESNPTLISILDRVADLDWYFAMDLRREILSLDFCITGELPSIDPDDRFASMRLPERFRTIQAGYRTWDNEVYVDHTRYIRGSEWDRSFLILHEALHGYIPYFDMLHYRHVRTMTRTLARIAEGSIRSVEDLYRVMTHEDILFPQEVARLNPHRDVIEFMTTDARTQDAIILAVPNPDQLFTISDEDYASIQTALLPEDAALGNPRDQLIRVLTRLMIHGSPQTFTTVVRDKTYTTLNIEAIALGIADQLTREKLHILSTLVAPIPVITASIDFIRSAHSYRAHDRICAEDRLISLSALSSEQIRELNTTSECVPVLSLLPRSASASELPAPLQASARLIGMLARLGQWERIDSATAQNTDFRSAFNLDHLLAEVQATATPIEREQNYVVQQIAPVAKGLLQQWVEVATQNLPSDDANQVRNRFGF